MTIERSFWAELECILGAVELDTGGCVSSEKATRLGGQFEQIFGNITLQQYLYDVRELGRLQQSLRSASGRNEHKITGASRARILSILKRLTLPGG